MAHPSPIQSTASDPKQDADYVFYELTRSICPECRRVIDAHILIRDNKVYMRKRCPDHGIFEALVYGDAQLYTNSSRFNKPGTIPLEFATEMDHGCPHDCGLCPDHQQHACLGIIEVNSACDMACPLCFAEAGPGFNLTLEEVEDILDHFVSAGRQSSGGAVLRRRALDPSADHPDDASGPAARHPQRDAEHQRQAHRDTTTGFWRSWPKYARTSISSSTASTAKPIASSAASRTFCRRNCARSTGWRKSAAP